MASQQNGQLISSRMQAIPLEVKASVLGGGDQPKQVLQPDKETLEAVVAALSR